MAKMVRLLTAVANGSRRTTLPLPKPLSDHIPDGQYFMASLTDEGILFTPIDGPAEAEQEAAPKWARLLAKKRAKQTVPAGGSDDDE